MIELSEFRERFIRVYPGRIRTEVYGLQDNQRLAEQLIAELTQLPGVQRVQLTDQDLYSKVLIRGTILGFGSLGLFAASLAAGASLPLAQTIAFTTLVCGQLIQTFSWKQEGSSKNVKDRFLLGALGASALALLSTMYIPAFASFFHTAPLGINHWLQVLLVSGTVTMVSKPIHRLITKKREAVAAMEPNPLPAIA